MMIQRNLVIGLQAKCFVVNVELQCMECQVHQKQEKFIITTLARIIENTYAT